MAKTVTRPVWSETLDDGLGKNVGMLKHERQPKRPFGGLKKQEGMGRRGGPRETGQNPRGVHLFLVSCQCGELLPRLE